MRRGGPYDAVRPGGFGAPALAGAVLVGTSRRHGVVARPAPAAGGEPEPEVAAEAPAPEESGMSTEPDERMEPDEHGAG